jgi:hypothetical protein
LHQQQLEAAWVLTECNNSRRTAAEHKLQGYARLTEQGGLLDSSAAYQVVSTAGLSLALQVATPVSSSRRQELVHCSSSSSSRQGLPRFSSSVRCLLQRQG